MSQRRGGEVVPRESKQQNKKGEMGSSKRLKIFYTI